MKASTSRVIYCAGLFLLAACAVMPERPPADLTAAVAVSRPEPAEVRLAHAMRQSIEIEIALGARHPEVTQARAQEAALRAAVFTDARKTRPALIDALADELSDALALRSALARTDARRPAAEMLVKRLTAAINREVHGGGA